MGIAFSLKKVLNADRIRASVRNQSSFLKSLGIGYARMIYEQEAGFLRKLPRQVGIASVNAVPFAAEAAGRTITSPNLLKGFGLGILHAVPAAVLFGVDFVLSHPYLTAPQTNIPAIDILEAATGAVIGLSGLVYGLVSVADIAEGAVLGVRDGVAKTTERYIPRELSYGPFFLPKREREENNLKGGSVALRRSTNPIKDINLFPSVFFTERDEFSV